MKLLYKKPFELCGVIVSLVVIVSTHAEQPSISRLVQQAENGDATAMLEIGRHLQGTRSADGLEWIRKAATAFDEEENWRGLFGACLDLAEMSPDEGDAARAKDQLETMIAMAADDYPDLARIDFAEWRPLLDRAWGLELHSAATLIGQKLRESGDKKSAFDWYLKAATKGHPPAMVQVGLMYSNGDGVAMNLKKAAAWLRPANVKKSATGKHLLAECFLYGKGVDKNQKLAVKLLHEAISLQESGRSLDLLAACYHKGWGVDADPIKAAQLYQQACEEDYYNACANLAVLYMIGTGVTQNESVAVDLLTKGVEKNNSLCMYFYGLAQWDGRGVRKSRRKAKKWMIQAAESGNEHAVLWCKNNNVAFTSSP